MTTAAVRFDRVSKRFRLGEGRESLVELIAAAGRRLIGQSRPRDATSFLALNDVSFDVPKGDTLGIIGPNGAGKSTALKLLAGILRPDSGSIAVQGRLAALIEVGAGFHGDLTGRENIFLHAAILGMRRAEVRGKLDTIVSFAGLERFLDMPVKRYSSGMYARLGFSIAAHVEPDVLLVDEVLSVGDAVFRVRCLERMKQLVRAGTTLIFVTHDLGQMQAVCARAVVLSHGRVAFAGRSKEAVAHYLAAMSQVMADRPGDMSAESSAGVDVFGVRLLSADGAERANIEANRPVRIEIDLESRRPFNELAVELNLRSGTQEAVASFNSSRSGVTYELPSGRHSIRVDLPSLPLAGGQYYWNVRVWDAGRGVVEADTPFRFPMVVFDNGRGTGMLCLQHAWSPGAMPLECPSNGSRAARQPVAEPAEAVR
jgi:ABC-type polysaccharide/polyol phosphate transport system ATPase subunit